MPIQLKRNHRTTLAQTIRIRDHSLTTDLLPTLGGDDSGPGPHDFYDAALGACKALTVLWFAKRKGIMIDDIETTIERDDKDERNGTYHLSTTLKISGTFTDEEFAQLTHAAENCPVHKLMTTVTTEISTVVERAT